MAVNVWEAFVALVVSQLVEYGPDPVNNGSQVRPVQLELDRRYPCRGAGTGGHRHRSRHRPPPAGLVILTVGGGVEFETVTDTADEVVF